MPNSIIYGSSTGILNYQHPQFFIGNGSSITSPLIGDAGIYINQTGIFASTSTITLTGTTASIVSAPFSMYTTAKNFIRNQLSPPTRKPALFDYYKSKSEQKAQFLLREFLTELEFFKYLRRGWVTRLAKSGLVYNIPLEGHVRIFDGKKHLEDLCIHVTKDVPPSDRMFTLLSLLDFDEGLFRASGNLKPAYTGPRMVVGNGLAGGLIVPGRPSLAVLCKSVKESYITVSNKNFWMTAV